MILSTAGGGFGGRTACHAPMAIVPFPLLIKQVVYMGQQSAQLKDYIPHLLGVVSATVSGWPMLASSSA